MYSSYNLQYAFLWYREERKIICKKSLNKNIDLLLAARACNLQETQDGERSAGDKLRVDFMRFPALFFNDTMIAVEQDIY